GGALERAAQRKALVRPVNRRFAYQQLLPVCFGVDALDRDRTPEQPRQIQGVGLEPARGRALARARAADTEAQLAARRARRHLRVAERTADRRALQRSRKSSMGQTLLQVEREDGVALRVLDGRAADVERPRRPPELDADARTGVERGRRGHIE